MTIENKVNGMTYIGEVDVGLRPSGTGLEYSPNGKLQYLGQYLRGNRHGKGTFYHPSGSKAYQGDFDNGQMQGHGMVFDEMTKKVLYRGTISNGSFVDGSIYKTDGSLLGTFSKGKLSASDL